LRGGCLPASQAITVDAGAHRGRGQR
jgi:hypothetical protein